MSIRRENTIIQILLAVILLVGMHLLFVFGVRLGWYFCLGLILVYLIMMPKKLMNPKNFVFGYYFMFYGLATLFANRYKTMYEDFGSLVNEAYLMCFTTYVVIMITLNVCLCKCEAKIRETDKKNFKWNESIESISNFERCVIYIGFFLALAIYIQKTGGLLLWLTDANAAFFSRRGSGLYYILFTNMLMILLFLENQNKILTKKDLVKRCFYLFFLLGVSIFIGSRSTTFIMVLMLFSYAIMKLNLLDARSVVLGLVGVAVFLIGMYIRLKEIMNSFSAVLSTSLNYFDTFENLLISLRDFEPSYGKTVFLPINWVLMKFGMHFGVPYHDMSIWLTTVYYPDSWINGGTTQWPIETDMYMSFMYYGGLPLVVIYFVIISYLYSKAQEKSAWRLVYINEAMMIISHLRGGIFIYWYFWLIPLYAWLILKHGKNKQSPVIESIEG